MKRYFLVLWLGFFGSQCFAQDYVITTSTYQQGKVSKHKDKEIMLRQKVEGYKSFSVDTVVEYKAGGTIYKALVVNGKRNFYEQLEKGPMSLYRLKNTYVLADSAKLIPVDKSNFRSTLSSTLQCSGDDTSLSKLVWTKPALKYIVRRYNKSGCDSDVIPHRKFGVVAGYNLMKLKVVPEAGWSPTQKINVPSIGVFADLPILVRRSKLYFTFEANYMAFTSTYYSSTPMSSRFVGVEVSGLNALGSLKINVSRSRNVKPYIKLGFMTSFLNVDSPTGYIESTAVGNVITLDGQPATEFGKSTTLGLNTAAGIEVPLVSRLNLHFEIRATRSIFDTSDLNLGISNVGLSVGITF